MLQPPEPLHLTAISCSLPKCSVDVVGPIDPASLADHIIILAATDYFSKWYKVILLKSVLEKAITNFVWMHTIFRYGIPDRIISDNGSPFESQNSVGLQQEFHLIWRYSTIDCPKAKWSC
ncbi:hypothetical protein AMTRI_Chr13g122410 [Amborella trichopoda]